MELEVTWMRAIKVWWAMGWRSFVLGVLLSLPTQFLLPIIKEQGYPAVRKLGLYLKPSLGGGY